jgi:TetR/AcrR family transcriptional regulator, lmrAB and yxaGH operons repressor
MARLLRDQGYAATGRAQVLAESGVSNGSLYHYFPGGMEQLAQAALEASGNEVSDTLGKALEEAPSAAVGVCRFLDIAYGPVTGEGCPGCPIAPTALESPIISPLLRNAATRCFDQWESLVAARLRADGWPEHSVPETASAVLALIEGVLLLVRVTGKYSHLASAKQAVVALVSAPPTGTAS